MTLSLLITESDALLREFLAHTVDSEDDLAAVAAVSSGQECLDLLEDTRPDLVLLGLGLSGPNGWDVLDALGQSAVSPRVLVLAGAEGEDVQLETARRGAHGFLPKSQAHGSLLQAIRAVARGESWFGRQIADRILLEYQQLLRREKEREAPLGQLTGPERDVLAGVARGLTNKQIAAELYVSIHTVKSRI